MVGKICLATCLLLAEATTYGKEACGRTATISGQEVLVDISLSSKGEGLRPYLAKDAVAHSYLEQYQKTGFSQNKSALFGSAAIGLIAGGALAPQDSHWGPFGRQDFIIIGATLLAVNYLVSRAIATKNEKLLHNSINEYNKRNYPKIYFLPHRKQGGSAFEGKHNLGIRVGLHTLF